MSNIIEVKNLNKTFGNFKAVSDLSFQVEEATCFGLLGPNGAGKTTTMKMVYGMAEYDKNKNTVIDVFSFDPKKQSLNIKALAGVVPQDNNLDLELDVFQNLYIYSKFYGMKKKDAIARIDELLEFMELGDRKTASVRELSGGMQRRLVIVRALLNNPKLLILDEPTTGLDPQVRHLIWNKIRNLRKTGVTILLTTHYMEEAYQLCDKIIIMDKGKKVLEGSPKMLLKNNIENYVMEIPNKLICSEDIEPYIGKYELRKEDYRDTCYIYSSNMEFLRGIEGGLESSEYYIRESNLEDLFLKVTGRSLNESQ